MKNLHRTTQGLCLFCDADNTLWNTDAVYAEVQLELLSILENVTGNKVYTNKCVESRLEYVRKIDQHIARLHGFNLKYPPRILVMAVEGSLLGQSPKEAATNAVSFANIKGYSPVYEKHEKWFLDKLKEKLPELRIGVKEGLFELHKMGIKPVVITEGSKDKCFDIITKHGLQGIFSKIIEVRKSTESFKKICLEMDCVSCKCIIVGDQIDRDIMFSKEAGFYTVLFPGGFNPRWNKENKRVIPHRIIDNFLEIVDIVKTI